jgi:DNA-binding XRE family transcriptional regulator
MSRLTGRKRLVAKAAHGGKARSKNKAVGRPRRKVPSAWGIRIEAMASRSGLSRTQLADRIGISYVSMWQLLMGQTKPKMETACRLADALGVPLDKLRQ